MCITYLSLSCFSQLCLFEFSLYMCFCYSREFQEKGLCDTENPQILNVIYSLKMLQFQPHFLIKPLYVTTNIWRDRM